MFQKQKVMRRVLYSLTPLFLFSIFLYGWIVLTTVLVTFIFGIATEYVFEKTRKKKVSEAVLVTCALYALSLPPNTPLWITTIGIIFAVAIGKGVYGGFGRNIFNPAITGRLFVYITFPTVLTTAWMVPALVNLHDAWSITGVFGSSGISGVDALTAATPLAMIRSGVLPQPLEMFLGFRGGSFGESSVLLIILAAVYLIWTKTANWRLILSTFISAVIATGVFYFAGWIPGLVPSAFSNHLVPIVTYLMSGSILYVAVFMSTDPISAPNKPSAQFVYGFLIGAVSITVRTFSGFPEGTSFGIMIGNTFSALLDEIMPAKKKKSGKSQKTQPKSTQPKKIQPSQEVSR